MVDYPFLHSFGKHHYCHYRLDGNSSGAEQAILAGNTDNNTIGKPHNTWDIGLRGVIYSSAKENVRAHVG